MKRKEFLQSALASAALVSIPPSMLRFLDQAHASSTGVDLAIAKGGSPGQLTRTAINALGGIRRFISRGDIVVIKPNMGWDRAPIYAANTNPEVVATMVQLCFEAGARKVKLFDRTVNDPHRCYKNSGIADRAKALGAEVSFMDERRYRDMSIKGETLTSWPLYKDIFEADKLINIPIAKHHSLSQLTMALKNWMGVMGGWRGKIHWQIDTKLADLMLVIKPTLTILDANRILTENGPSGGSLQYVKTLRTVAASTDQVAIDAFGATLFGMTGADLGFVKKAAERNLGMMDLHRLRKRLIQL